jgi:hypothetical protein
MNEGIRNLITELEEARLGELRRLTSSDVNGTTVFPENIRNLAYVQLALAAAKETLEEHQPHVGYGGESMVAAPEDGNDRARAHHA